jgi:hypothetical protein
MISYFKRNDATIYHRAKNGNKWFNESSTKIGEILYNGAELDIPTTEAHLKQLIEKIDEKTGADLEYDGFKFRNVLLIEDMVGEC